MSEVSMSEGPRKYMPANGTEGDVFMETFCNRCKREEPEGSCDILTNAFLAERGEGPDEWQYRGERAHCTAFEAKSPEVAEAYRRWLAKPIQPSEDR